MWGFGWERVLMEVSLGDVCGGAGRVSVEGVSGCVRSWESRVTVCALTDGRAMLPLLGELRLGQAWAEHLKGGRTRRGPWPRWVTGLGFSRSWRP